MTSRREGANVAELDIAKAFRDSAKKAGKCRDLYSHQLQVACLHSKLFLTPFLYPESAAYPRLVAMGRQQWHASAGGSRHAKVGTRRRAMQVKVRRGGHRSRYRLRKQTVKPVFGQINRREDFGRCSCVGSRRWHRSGACCALPTTSWSWQRRSPETVGKERPCRHVLASSGCPMALTSLSRRENQTSLSEDRRPSRRRQLLGQAPRRLRKNSVGTL